MLSDEEKKAMEIVKGLAVYYDDYGLLDEEEIEENEEVNNSINIILNLIEKQSKEIEELNKSDASKEQSSINYYNLYKELVDKIKAKIEDLRDIADNGANAVRFAMTHDDEVERIQKQKDISTMLQILQSLLEKE